MAHLTTRAPGKGATMRPLTAALAASLLIATAPALAADPTPDLAGLSPACQGAAKAMRACLQQTIDAGAPDTIRAPWEKQIADSVKMWRAAKDKPETDQSCKDITAKYDCE
ncbi:hypothetical protein [Sphingomonas crocodyli]|uniref:hypothetical protein n=1 Tax=Sphingomonas crocodyli TaxID=1979270 RepID=UPI0013E3EAAF|nr:hypothetical protein [Sphingomonas crocodyli]